MFSSPSNVTIHGGSFVDWQIVQAPKDWERARERDAAWKKLEQHVALGAFHNSRERRDAPKCLPRTREAVFREISEWIRVTSVDKPILWLYGPAGAGKSAIAQSISEKVCRREIAECLLVATFFFIRSNDQRNKANRLIPSLAYQMTSSIPQTREFVSRAIIETPHVFALNLGAQMKKLIIEPLILAGVADSHEGLPMLIIIDGLDECKESEERTEIIQALADNVTNPSFHLIILCHSRPESDIRAAFSHSQALNLSTRIVLDNPFNPDSDIWMVLKDDFVGIKRVHPLRNHLPRDWPPEAALGRLVRKSSGQFIYASTAMKYIGSRKHHPMKRLEVVLNTGNGTDASPFKELDALYTLILSSVDKKDRPALVRILGLVCFPDPFYSYYKKKRHPNLSDSNRRSPQVLPSQLANGNKPPRVIDGILRLKHGETHHILDNLHALINVGDPRPVPTPFHASLRDFLEDKSRSAEYHVSRPVVEADHTLAYFKHLLREIKESFCEVTLEECNLFKSFTGELTEELKEFFKTMRWKDLLESVVTDHVFPSLYRYRRCPKYVKPGMDWENPPWLWVVEGFHDFCKAASDRSSTWATVLRRLHRELTAWLTDFLDLVSSSCHTAFICAVQDSLRISYIWKLMGYTHKDGLPSFLIGLFETPGISSIQKIDRQKHNLAIFDTILEGLVTDNFACYNRHSPIGEANCRTQKLEAFVSMLHSSDRTSPIDTVLSYFGGKDSSVANNHWPLSCLEGSEVVQEAIKAYKQRPIPANYDYGFQLEPSVKVLRKRHKKMCERSNTPEYDGWMGPVFLPVEKDRDLICLSDLGVCNFIRLEKKLYKRE